ncbi:MAG: hypothetical protein SH868_03105 [Bythopirellula sp.]|nr:hypothetical protein [Bythopirellula sp.]
MTRFLILLAGCAASLALVDSAKAQVVHVTYFAPAMPVTTFYAPPCPVVQTAFFAPAPVVTYQPVTVARTRYRPFLGGTVTRFRPALAPVVVNPAPVFFGF